MKQFNLMRITLPQWVATILLVVAAVGLIKKQLFEPSVFKLGHRSGFHVTMPKIPAVSMPSEILYQERTVSQALTNEVHAASLSEGPNGSLHAFWYGGSREGGKDVAIYGAELKRGDQNWSSSRKVVTRSETQAELHRYIKKLGNPVVAMDQQERLWLFYVSVSVGGWAGSAINVKWSDDGVHWSPAKRLITSPFVNISTLVKGNPILYNDGHFGVPVYHEFIGKFGELIELDLEGNVYNKQRFSSGRESLQPILLVEDGQRAQTYLRFAGEKPHKVLLTETFDAGRSWSHPVKTALPNPNAAIAGMRIQGGPFQDGLMMVFNNSPESRNRLSLGYSKDNGRSWQLLHDFEFSDDTALRFSYPYMIQSSDGHYHLVYSWDRLYIKHIEFNDRWLQQQLSREEEGV